MYSTQDILSCDSLEKAAGMLAERAVVGRKIREMRKEAKIDFGAFGEQLGQLGNTAWQTAKENPLPFLGAGVGALTAGGTSLMNPRKRRHAFRNALYGGLTGGVTGLAGQLAWRGLNEQPLLGPVPTIPNAAPQAASATWTPSAGTLQSAAQQRISRALRANNPALLQRELASIGVSNPDEAGKAMQTAFGSSENPAESLQAALEALAAAEKNRGDAGDRFGQLLPWLSGGGWAMTETNLQLERLRRLAQRSFQAPGAGGVLGKLNPLQPGGAQQAFRNLQEGLESQIKAKGLPKRDLKAYTQLAAEMQRNPKAVASHLSRLHRPAPGFRGFWNWLGNKPGAYARDSIVIPTARGNVTLTRSMVQNLLDQAAKAQKPGIAPSGGRFFGKYIRPGVAPAARLGGFMLPTAAYWWLNNRLDRDRSARVMRELGFGE